MGFSSVVLIGHDDGGLMAMMAAQKVQASSNSFNVSIYQIFLTLVDDFLLQHVKLAFPENFSVSVLN